MKKAALWIAAQVFPAIGLGAAWEQALGNPVVTLILGVVYESAVFIALYGRKVLVTAWERHEPFFFNECVVWVDFWILGSDRRFRSRYRKAVENNHKLLNTRGLTLKGSYAIDLDRVFVDLRIAPSANPTDARQDPLGNHELVDPQQIWDILRSKTALSDGVALAIIGPPGSGKSTLLQHVTLALAASRHRRHRCPSYFPILLAIREHAESIVADESITLGDVAQAHFTNQKLFNGLNPPPGWFERRLRRGGCLVLLDGLDEVAKVEDRAAVSNWIDRQIQAYPSCRVIVTARPRGYADTPLQRAHVVEVLPFTDEQVRRFVGSWYLAEGIYASMGRETDLVRHQARLGADELLARLRDRPALADLTVNPLLLTMIAMVHKYRGSLPGSRADLYKNIFEVFLGRWREAIDIPDSLNEVQKRVVLQPLAARMMERQTPVISLTDALEIIRGPLGRVGWGDRDPAVFVREIQAGSGLLLEREDGVWGFAHLSFQEYLTSVHWCQSSSAAPAWDGIVGESWWQETCRLYSAQTDATMLVEACLRGDSVTALTLAAECLEEPGQLDPTVRTAVETRVVADLESADEARRRLAAEVQLTRRLNRLKRIDDDCEIDLDYLSCAEYQLFVDDVRSSGAYRQPDHWPNFRFASGQSREPVTGVRAEEAEAFCAWLTERRGGQAQFRLPTPAEARQQPGRLNWLAAWCSDSSLADAECTMAVEAGREIDRLLSGREGEGSRVPLPSGGALPLTRDFDHAIALSHAHARALARLSDLTGDLARASASTVASASDLARAFDLASASTLASASGSALALAGVRILDLDLDLGSDSTIARASVRALGLAGVRTLDLDLDRDRDLDRDHHHHASARDLVLASALSRASDLTRALDLDLASHLALARALASVPGVARVRALAVAGVRILDLDLDLDRDLASHLALASDLARDHHHASASVLASVEARRIIGELASDSDERVAHIGTIIVALIDAASADSVLGRRRAWRRAALVILTMNYVILNDTTRNQDGARRWWRRLWDRLARQPAGGFERDELMDAVAREYWSIWIVMEREAGRLPAWEGIRIVRERLPA